MLVGIIGSASAQHDDLYFVPKKKKAKTEAQPVKTEQETPLVSSEVETSSLPAEDSVKTLSVTTFSAKGLPMDADTYNRRGSYLTEQGDAVSEFAMQDEGFVLITEEGDTMWMNTDTLKLTRVDEGEGWVNGFEGSDSDYEYAMRIIRFRNPRYAIPVSSPLYWDVVYGGALWPSWDWNIYDDGLYAYVFPTSSNWYYWDYMMSYPFGWHRWNHHWGLHYSHHWGPHWGMGHYWDGWGFYGHVWYDPWFNPYFHGYHPGWHHGHHGFYPGFGAGKPGWGGVTPGKPQPRENERHATIASTRRGSQDNNAVSRGATTATRRGTSVTRTDNGSTRSSSVRVVTGRTGSSSNRSSGAVRSSSSRSGSDDVLRREGNTSSSVSRGATTGSSSRSSYTRQSTSRSSSGSSYNRPSSTRSSSSSISRSSSSSSSPSSSYSSSSSSSSRSSSYSSGSSYSGGGSSYSGGGSRGGGSSSSGGSRGGGGGGSRR